MGKGSENTLLIDSSQTEANDGGQLPSAKPFISWSEVKKHDKSDDCWIVVNNNVYNMTKFQRIHPGGSRVISHYAGQDATEVFNAFHKEYDRVNKYAKLYHIGMIDPADSPVSAAGKTASSADERQLRDKLLREAQIRNDFAELRKTATQMGCFKSSFAFFFLSGLQILLCQVGGYFILWKYGGGLVPVLCAFLCHLIAQGQASWNQHDYGHSSLESPKYNKILHLLLIALIKGASPEWWKYMHNQHHAKPNVMNKDPDVRMDPILILGKIQPVEKATRNVKSNERYLYPYTIQHYIFPFLAPLLFPVYFFFMNFRYAYLKKRYMELPFMYFMYIFHMVFTYMVFQSVPKTLAYYFLIRLCESTWFGWVSQSNHIVMDVHPDYFEEDSWFSLQLKATCNIETSTFNDWFTGHLNFQIEHHLFPTMPRHNLYKVQPLVQSLCKKHGIDYVVKPLGKAFLDILLSLRKSGEIWKEAYDELLVK